MTNDIMTNNDEKTKMLKSMQPSEQKDVNTFK
jgi:hypothetical protein